MSGFKKSCLWFAVGIILCLVWIGLEYELDGVVINQQSDAIICLLTSWLIVDKIDNVFQRRINIL